MTVDQPLRLQTRLLAAVSIFAIACAAAFVRYWPLLHGQPGGLYPDEASEGIAALRILNDPWYKPVFIDENGGREALFAYLVAVSIKLLGPSVLAIRATSAFVGLGGIAAAWFLLRRWGLLAAISGIAWMAGSPWLISTSALGLRNGLTVPFAGLAAGALLWWSDRPGHRRAVIAGFACGAGLWTYQPLKLTPLLMGAWLFWLRRSDVALFAKMWADRWRLVIGYVVAAIPYLWTAVTDPANYFGRIAGVAPVAPNMHANFLTHTLQTLGMFFVAGDANPRHDVDALPILLWPLPLIAALGLWRMIRERRTPAGGLVLTGLAVYLLPPLYAVEGGAPHFQRSLALAPFVAALVGAGVLEVIRLARSWTRPAAAATAAACAAVLIAIGAYGSIAFATRPASDLYEAFDYHSVQLAEAGALPNTVVIVGPYDAQAVRYLDPDVPIYEPGAPAPPGKRMAAFLLADLPPDAQPRASVYARDPQGRPSVWISAP